MTRLKRGALRAGVLSVAGALALSGCGFSPYDLPLPGGADTGSHPYKVTAEFRDVLDLVPQSGVRVNDLAVGKVTDIELKGWTAKVTLEINGDVKLPDNAQATIRQTSLLGEKFVSLAPPKEGATGRLSDGDNLPLAQTGRNPEIEEVFSAASLLLNGGGLERTNTIFKELNNALDGNEAEVKELLSTSEQFLGQLDDNKQALIGSLEKVNRLAVNTNQQKDAITGALDSLPGALKVVNSQRDDLVKLLQALDKLGDTATDVIRQTKDDTVADLKALTPVLQNLSGSTDELAYDFKALLTFPFTDGMAGGTYARVSAPCDKPAGENGVSWCTGDFANLSIRLDVDAAQLDGVLKAAGIDFSQLGLGNDGSVNPGGLNSASATSPTDEAIEEFKALTESFSGLGGSSDSQDSGSTTKKKSSCNLLFLCRPGVSSVDTGQGLTSLMLATTAGRGGSVQ